LQGGGRAKVIAGTLTADGQSTSGPILGLSTDPLYVDIELPAGAVFSHPVSTDYNVFLYPYEGSVNIGSASVLTHSAGVLSAGDRIEVAAGADGARFILLAARPLGEPVVQYGPFVMNTREEIEQAMRDYQNGELVRPAA